MKKIDKQIFKALEEITTQQKMLGSLASSLISLYIGTYILDVILKEMKGGKDKNVK